MPRQPLRVGTPRCSNVRTRSKRRRRRQSVGDVLGVTPGKERRRHLREAGAYQDAESAAAALDAMVLEPSSKTRRDTRKRRGKAKATTATQPRELPPGFEGESPFMWNTIEMFDSPAAGNDAWLGGGRTESTGESKNMVEELDTKTPEPHARIERMDQSRRSGRSETDRPEDTDDRDFLKDKSEEDSRDNCPDTGDEDYEYSSETSRTGAPNDGGESNDTLSDEGPATERDQRPRKEKGKRKQPGKRRSQPDDPDPSDHSSDGSDYADSSSDIERRTRGRKGNRAHRKKLPKRQRRNRRSYRERRHASATLQ